MLPGALGFSARSLPGHPAPATPGQLFRGLVINAPRWEQLSHPLLLLSAMIRKLRRRGLSAARFAGSKLPSRQRRPRPPSAPAPAPAPARASGVPLLYIVDNDPWLTDLYTFLLHAEGYHAVAFNERPQALAALEQAREIPDLLIMDYLGHAMSAQVFMRCCLALRPGLRILIASGLHDADRRCYPAKPSGFIQKPFTAEAFLRKINSLLAA